MTLFGPCVTSHSAKPQQTRSTATRASSSSCTPLRGSYTTTTWSRSWRTTKRAPDSARHRAILAAPSTAPRVHAIGSSLDCDTSSLIVRSCHTAPGSRVRPTPATAFIRETTLLRAIGWRRPCRPFFVQGSSGSSTSMPGCRRRLARPGIPGADDEDRRVRGRNPTSARAVAVSAGGPGAGADCAPRLPAQLCPHDPVLSHQPLHPSNASMTASSCSR
jgi:hypothetical protein